MDIGALYKIVQASLTMLMQVHCKQIPEVTSYQWADRRYEHMESYSSVGSIARALASYCKAAC